MRTDTIDLQPFCASEETYWLLDRPFVFNGWRYACDGRICVRVPAPGEPDDEWPAPGEPDDEWDGGLPKKVFSSMFHSVSATAPWPTDGEVRGECECGDCDGEGKVGIESNTCRNCGGEGECLCCGRECEKCDGEGAIESGGHDCPACSGMGRVEGLLHRVVGVHCIAGKYDALIRALQNVRYEVGAKINVGDDLATIHAKPLAFVFDGGEGVMAPYSSERS